MRGKMHRVSLKDWLQGGKVAVQRAGVPGFLQEDSQQPSLSRERVYCFAIKPVFKYRLQGDFEKFTLPLLA